MNSRTSFFNKTIFFKNIVRFWPVWVCYTAIMFFTTIWQALSILFDKEMYDSVSRAESIRRYLTLNLNIPMIMFVSVLSALLVFSYLFRERSANMMHAFPVNKKTLYVTSFISGLLFLLLPQTVIFLIGIPVSISGGCGVYLLLSVYLYTMAFSFIFYTIAVLCCVMSGHVVGAIFYYFAFNAVYMVVKFIVAMLAEAFCYGVVNAFNEIFYRSTYSDVLSPVYFLYSRCTQTMNIDLNISSVSSGSGNAVNFYTSDAVSSAFPNGGVLAVYSVAFVAIAVLGFFMYKKRHIETAGNMCAFSWMKPFTRWATAFCTGGFAACFACLIIDEMAVTNRAVNSFANYIIWFVVIASAVLVIMQMFIKRSFKVFKKKFLIEWLCGMVLIILIFVIGRATGFGVSSFVPKASDVSKAFVVGDYTIEVDDESGIEDVIAIHENILKNRSENQRFVENYDYKTDVYYYLKIAYALKNGKTVCREYEIPANAEFLENTDSSAYTVDEFQKKMGSEAFIKAIGGEVFDEGEWYIEYDIYEDEDLGTTAKTLQPKVMSEKEQKSIEKALIADIEAGNILYRSADRALYDLGYENENDTDEEVYELDFYAEIEGEADSPAREYGRDILLYNTFGFYAWYDAQISLTYYEDRDVFETTFNWGMTITPECENTYALLQKLVEKYGE